jgi:hypothetical protein
MCHSMRMWTLGSALVLLGGCSGTSTEVTSAWHAPNPEPYRFNKVLAVCMCRDETTRRAVEDQLASRVRGGVAAYTVIPEAAIRDTAQAQARLRDAGFDGVVVMRLVGVDKEQTYVPGSAYMVPAGYNSMWGFWGTGYSAMYQPGYIDENQVVRFDTNVYTVSDRKLVWASKSDTYDPESVAKAADAVVTATVTEMKKERVLAE